MSKAERVNRINEEIVALILGRSKASRRNDWPAEEKIYKKIEELEKKIKAIEGE